MHLNLKIRNYFIDVLNVEVKKKKFLILLQNIIMFTLHNNICVIIKLKIWKKIEYLGNVNVINIIILYHYLFYISYIIIMDFNYL